MDIMSLIGLVFAVAALIGGSILKGAGVKALGSSAAFVIVLVGTLAAIMLQTPGKTMKRAFAIVPWIIKPPVLDAGSVIERLPPGAG